MEINNFIIFIIIILLSIILYKCAKIYNLRKIENFNTQLGLHDGHGNIERNVDPLTGNYINCKGNWSSCVYNDTNNTCNKTYEIENEDYIGSSCPHNTGDIKECIYDECNQINTYTKNGVEYHIMKGKTLIHYKKKNRNDNSEDIQEEIEYSGSGSGSDLWNDDKDGDDTNIQLQKLEKIMDEYNDNSDYIGLIKDDVLDGIPKFYPIILDEDSEIEIRDSPRRTLYMKKNIDCRGKWEKCEYNQESQRSERYYIIKYPGSGAGNSCAENNNEIQTCAEWSSCVTEENPNNYNKPHNIKKWEYKLPNNGCSDINQDCSNINNQEWIEEGCVQDRDCGVSWSDCENKDGLEKKQATIYPPATGNGRCAYEDGEWYHNKRVFNADGNIENKICNPLTGDNCICEQDDFPQPCKKKYNLYWGNGEWTGVQHYPNGGGIIRDSNGIPIPNNRVDDNEPGECWLHVYDYDVANNKFYQRNQDTGIAICPLDDYEYNGEYINIGSRIGTPVSDIGAGDNKITGNNYGYKFDIVSTTRECTTENRPHPDIPQDDLDALVANGENLINELDKANQLSDQEQLCNYRDLNNLKNTLNDIVNENQNNNSVNNIIRPLLNVVNTKLSLHSNYQSGTTNDWGEVCRSQGIYPQDCEYNEVETNCNNWRYGYNGKYNVINITKPNKYTGSCDVINGQAINTENCNRILVQDWFSSTLGGITSDLMSGNVGGAAGGIINTLSSF